MKFAKVLLLSLLLSSTAHARFRMETGRYNAAMYAVTTYQVVFGAVQECQLDVHTGHLAAEAYKEWLGRNAEWVQVARRYLKKAEYDMQQARGARATKEYFTVLITSWEKSAQFASVKLLPETDALLCKRALRKIDDTEFDIEGNIDYYAELLATKDEQVAADKAAAK